MKVSNASLVFWLFWNLMLIWFVAYGVGELRNELKDLKLKLAEKKIIDLE